jgi:hypothetical protein
MPPEYISLKLSDMPQTHITGHLNAKWHAVYCRVTGNANLILCDKLKALFCCVCYRNSLQLEHFLDNCFCGCTKLRYTYTYVALMLMIVTFIL